MKIDQIQKVGFAIQPKMDCPHLTEEAAIQIAHFLNSISASPNLQCNDCKDATQNWICLGCKSIKCSRYVKGHMADHNLSSNHLIALSFTDGSYWCYGCDSYIDTKLLIQPRRVLSKIKIAQQAGNPKETQQTKGTSQTKDNSEIDKLTEQIKGLQLEDQSKRLGDILEGLKAKKFTKIIVLTGAGLSVGAGIPDFRSPGTGLYSKLAKFNLPYPEAIFTLKYFKQKPEAFYSLAKQFLNGSFTPTIGHRFIKKLEEEGILLMNLTQNIDDLEVAAGISEDKLLQAHGHSRTAHCLDCKKLIPIAVWKEALQKDQILKCTSCEGLVKPDIVFFGEQLPSKFMKAPEIVESCDLAIIIGTSLKVMPFAYLAQVIPPKVPTILINNEDVLSREDRIWLKGDIQDNIKKLMKDLEWE